MRGRAKRQLAPLERNRGNQPRIDIARVLALEIFLLDLIACGAPASARVSTVAIAQGSLTISIQETPEVSQPTPLSQGGQTVTVPRTNIQIDQNKDKKLGILKQSVSLQVLVDGLNALGVGPRDMISILQTIKAAGALQADIEVR